MSNFFDNNDFSHFSSTTAENFNVKSENLLLLVSIYYLMSPVINNYMMSYLILTRENITDTAGGTKHDVFTLLMIIILII